MTVTDADYRRFVSGIRLQTLWLNESHVSRSLAALPKGATDVEIENRLSWGHVDQGFIALPGYRVTLRNEDGDEIARIEADFAVVYDARESVTEALIDRFQEANLPLNVWPYLREYVSATLARMGLPQVYLTPFTVYQGPSGYATDAQDPLPLESGVEVTGPSQP